MSGASVTLYHGSHERLDAFMPREVSSVDTLGTWATSRRAYAKHYGPVVMEVQIDVRPGEWFEIRPDAPAALDFLRLFGANVKLARAVGMKAEAAILEKTLPDYFLPGRHARLIESTKYEDMLEGARLAPKMGKIKQANEAARRLLNTPAYMKAMRGLLEQAGPAGIIFRESRIDRRHDDLPHDVFVIFHREPIPARIIETAGNTEPLPMPRAQAGVLRA